ncbi:MAG: hypothetical protein MJ201_04350 [Mycoplasmoidaceae bacterium]|nr:hypothetical protein [Mycoplasmoidaceae bacterium]
MESKIQLLAPIAFKQKGTFAKELNKLKLDGFLRVRIDGNVYSLDDKIDLDKNKFHYIDIIVDRIVLNEDNQTHDRLTEAVETCLKHGNNKVVI